MGYRLVFLLAALGPAAASTLPAQQPQPAAAQPEAGKKTEEAPIPLKVALTGAPAQKVGDGLLFNVEITNTSSAPVSLYDPSDVMDISLVGDDGFPSALPPVRSLLTLTSRDPKKTREILDQRRAFAVVAASVAVPEGAKTLADLGPTGEVVLEPGAKFVMTVRISRMLADAAKFIADQKEYAARPEPKGPPPGAPEVQAIRADRYMVRVLIPFVSNGKSMGRFLISNELKVDLK